MPLFRLENYYIPDADRIVTIAEIRSDGARLDGTFGMYRGFAEGTRSFDALAVFLFPWALIVGSAGLAAFGVMAAFVGIILCGWLYAYREGVLEWK